MSSSYGISVIIPVFNRESSIRRCIDSIINQTYSNIEIICVDDGSTDQSPEILDQYAARDKRIKVIHNSNGGASSARNCGITLATMPLLAFVDSDDYIEPDMYSKLTSVMIANKLDCVCCNYNRILPDGEVRAPYFPFGSRILGRSEILEEVVKNEIGFTKKHINSGTASVWNKIFIKKIINDHNIRFAEDRTHGEDWLFCIQYYAFISSMGFLPEPLCNYVVSSNSLVSKPRKNVFKTSVDALALFQEIFPEFEWRSGIMYEKIKNTPFNSALYYCKTFKGQTLENLLKDIYLICKEKNYYSEYHDLNKAQKKLKHALENADEKSFVQHLKQGIKHEYLIYSVNATLRKLIKTVLKYIAK